LANLFFKYGDIGTIRGILNGMRPASLAEPEDVAALQEQVARLRAASPSEGALLEALDYAEMVIRYVVDGSGTHDLIHKAEERLKPFLNAQ
jgi:hypothetical protein